MRRVIVAALAVSVSTSLAAQQGHDLLAAWEEPLRERFLVKENSRNGAGGTKSFWRARSSPGGSWNAWNLDTEVTAYFIRLGVDHGSTPPPPDPDPDPDPDPEPPTPVCTPTTTALRFDGGYDVSMCWRAPDGRTGQARSGIWASSQAGLLWFFDRENAEVLVKVLDGCSHNGHRWVFVAPVTDLGFDLRITGPGGRRWSHSNQQGKVASAKADTRAFMCSNELGGDVASAGGAARGGIGVDGGGPSRTGIRLETDRAAARFASPDPDGVARANTVGCIPTTTALRFDGGYEVSMCYRTPDGGEGHARSGIWASSQAGLLWFFNRENAEVLVKVLDGCAHNGHRWVYVAPVTDLGFDLWITGPGGRRWVQHNYLGTTASTRADTRAFLCTNEDAGAPLFADDFETGDTRRWDIAGKGPAGADPAPGTLAFEHGSLALAATAGSNYDVRVQKNIAVDGGSGGYSLSFDWKAVMRETPYGLDGVHLLFYDAEDQLVGSLRVVNSGQTRRGGNVLDHSCTRAAIEDRRCAGIGKLAERFGWERVSLDTAMIPGMDPAKVVRLELRAWVYNDAGSGGEMHFDNFELREKAPGGLALETDQPIYPSQFPLVEMGVHEQEGPPSDGRRQSKHVQRE